MIWMVALIGSLAGFLFGYDEGIIAGSLELVTRYFFMGNQDIGTMTGALPFGALFGSVVIGALLVSSMRKRFGRRWFLGCAAALFILGALGASVAENLSILVLSRLVLGLAIGMASVIAPLYLAETAPAHQRGAVVAVYQLAITLGILGAYTVNYALFDAGAWRGMFASSMIPATLMLIGVFFIPESPRWLLSAGRKQDAEQALCVLRRGNAASVQNELLDIACGLQNERSSLGAVKDLFQMPVAPVLCLAMLLFCLQQLSGINVIIYYAPQIFKQLGFEASSGQLLATLGIGIVNVLVTLLAMLWVDKMGRRFLLLLGFAGAAMSLTGLALAGFWQSGYIAYVALICLATYIFSFAVSIGPVPHIAMSELFPLSVRGLGMGFAAASNWTWNTAVVFAFPFMQQHWGIASTFLFYGLVCATGFIFVYRYMPETRNQSLEQITAFLMQGGRLSKLGRPKSLQESSS